jgi:hypothetical protein
MTAGNLQNPRTGVGRPSRSNGDLARVPRCWGLHPSPPLRPTAKVTRTAQRRSGVQGSPSDTFGARILRFCCAFLQGRPEQRARTVSRRLAWWTRRTGQRLAQSHVSTNRGRLGLGRRVSFRDEARVQGACPQTRDLHSASLPRRPPDQRSTTRATAQHLLLNPLRPPPQGTENWRQPRGPPAPRRHATPANTGPSETSERRCFNSYGPSSSFPGPDSHSARCQLLGRDVVFSPARGWPVPRPTETVHRFSAARAQPSAGPFSLVSRPPNRWSEWTSLHHSRALRRRGRPAKRRRYINGQLPPATTTTDGGPLSRGGG